MRHGTGRAALVALLACASTSHAEDGASYAPVPLPSPEASAAAEAPSASAEHPAAGEGGEAWDLHGRGSNEQLAEAAKEVTASLAAAATAPEQADVPPPAGPAPAAGDEAYARPDRSRPPRRRLDLAVALRAARPWSFTASATPIMYGSALAFKVEDAFSPAVLVLSLLTAVSVHAAGNLVNTYVDHQKGVDRASTSDQTIVSGALTEGQVGLLVGLAYASGALAGAPLLLLSRARASRVLGHLGLGGLAAYAYTAGPGLKYRALGDALIMSTFGPLLVSFAFIVQCGAQTWLPVVASLPLALHSGAILHANNARDADDDAETGVLTLAQIMKPTLSTVFYATLLLGPYALAAVRVVGASTLEALPLLTLPWALRLLSDFRRGMRRATGGGEPDGEDRPPPPRLALVDALVDMPKRTAKLQAAFALLSAVGLLLPSPPLGELLRSCGRVLLRSFYDRAHP